ncbi:FGGY family carbohydrate kinase, partial [Muriicola sp.]|uniref:FGGY family carbohydrate kinase n=1 Tax=Muriicola sp. TaxID=2020856 RepID=UPI003C72290E
MYYLGVDIGSSSIKVALVESNTGKVVGIRKEPEHEMAILAPKQNWSEQDPEDWWKYVCLATKNLLSHYGINNNEIHGIGISYQMHGLV